MLKVHGIHSPDLQPPRLPEEPDNCCVAIGLSIGPADAEAGDVFQFEVVTPTWLAANPDPRWGKGLLIVPTFSWDVVQTAIAKLVAGMPNGSWQEAALALSRPLSWEFESYQPCGANDR